MFRYLCSLLMLMFCWTASAAEPLMQYILTDESKPPSERSVAVVIGLDQVLGAGAYARALKQHGGFDTIVLLENEQVTRRNVMEVIRYFVGQNTSPRYMLIHVAVPAVDETSLTAFNYATTGELIPMDHIGLPLYPMELSGHTVITFDSPPSALAPADARADQFSATHWNNAHSAALTAGPSCPSMTVALTATVNEASGRRLSINEMVKNVASRCGDLPVVYMPVSQNENGSFTPRLMDSATFIPLGVVREPSPAPQPVISAPVAAIPQPETAAITTTDHKRLNTVGIGLLGTGAILTGVAVYEFVEFNAAMGDRKAALNTSEFATATRRANRATVGTSVLGALGAVSLSAGLVITF